MPLHLLELKFGPEAVAIWRYWVMHADVDRLLTWSEKILTAETVDQIFSQ